MSLERRRMDLVAAAVEKLVADGRADGRAEFHPGDVVSRLREQNQPMGTWEVRGELSKLEAEGLIENDPDTGAWRLAPQRSLKTG